jgi:nitrogen regulatory protein PII
MKKIEAIVQPFRSDEVRLALGDAGVSGVTVTDVMGHGRQRGRNTVYRGQEYAARLVAKTKIEVVVGDRDVEETVQAVLAAARTGKIGDGKIFILEVDEAIRIRDGSLNEAAV